MKFNENLSNLQTYEAGKPIELIVREYGVEPEDVIKLASNENPFGASPSVVKAIKKCAKKANLYPDDSYFELKNALCKRFDVESNNIIIGAGSDQIIEFLFHAKLNRENAILMAKTTFAMYEIYAKMAGANVIKCESEFHNLDEFAKIYEANKDKIAIIALCVPNNPLGECLSASEIYDFLGKISPQTAVLIDAAYNEFATFKDEKMALNPRELIAKFPNVIYAGTFSKLYGLGGLRVGYGVANSQIISKISKLRPPFNITNISLAAAIAALDDKEYIEKTLKNNAKQMKKFENFARENGIEFIKSYTNFITFKLKNASEICEKLLQKGIILRNLKSYNLNAVRITIGTPAQNRTLLKELKKLL